MKLTELFCLTLFCLLMSACQSKEEKFSEKKPYAIIVEKYRSLDAGWAALNRVEEMGIRGYLAQVKDPESGTWYMILTGAFSTLESAIANRIEFEDAYSFLYLDIVNYNQLAKHLVAYVAEHSPKYLPDTLSSTLFSYALQELIKHIPYSDNYTVEDVKLIQNPDSINIIKKTSLRTDFFDMPRGVYPPNLIKASDAFTEIVYLDELIGVRFTVDVFALKPDHEFGADVSKAFAEKIIGTREYDFEEMLPRAIESTPKLNGFAVNIEPRKGKIFRYLVLQDLTGRYLYLIQSAKCSQEQIDLFANSIVREKGLLSYKMITEQMYMLPDSLPVNSTFTFAHLRKLIEVPGSTGIKLEKHFKSKFVFYDKLKGEWEINSTRIYDKEIASTIFRNVYTPRKRRLKDSVTVKNHHAWLTKIRLRNPKTRKYENYPNEIQLATDKFIVVLSNKRYAKLTQDEMTDILDHLNFNPVFKEEKGFLQSIFE
ncbi:MAG: hypothetical protein AAGI07_19940 [Bacteroidota bacterium]